MLIALLNAVFCPNSRLTSIVFAMAAKAKPYFRAKVAVLKSPGDGGRRDGFVQIKGFLDGIAIIVNSDWIHVGTAYAEE